MRILVVMCGIFGVASTLSAVDRHVAPTGNDANPGTAVAPLRTIQRAAELAQPGDVVTVHAGVYRERVDPPRGGESESKRIVYQAAPGEKVEVKGSEVIKGWIRLEGDNGNIWSVSLSNSFFGTFNPYAELIHGDYMFANRKNQHTGMVYLNGVPLTEAENKGELLKSKGNPPLWFGEAKKDTTTLWGWFKDMDPNQQTVEINVRRAVFYPSREQINYLTVRGFHMSQAAANWAPPTAEQIGLIGTHWSRGWIIEDNTITHSRCVGITLGKFGDKYDNTYKMDSQGWEKGVQEALAYGWSKDVVGHHLVRNNRISFCGQAGIVGSLGAVFSTISNNVIHDAAWKQRFDGYETAGIKFHAPVDVTISGNHIYRSAKGIWLDWMSQGARITRNLFHDNVEEDLFVEVNHGPILVDNNIFLSKLAVLEASEGGAYVHNLFAGAIKPQKETRKTPIFKPHTIEFLGLFPIGSGDERFYNNLFFDHGLHGYRGLDTVYAAGNVYVGIRQTAQSAPHEQAPKVLSDRPGSVKLVEQADGFYLQADLSVATGKDGVRPLVTTELLGAVIAAKQRFVNPDGSPLRIDTDYFGKARDEKNPAPGPFEQSGHGPSGLKVWGK